ncbi:hypothetical protein [Dongia rigui]|uniref:Transmembrane protein n=1 Tax=Dongia rigui TaxID=940149 RepID=A0ABU5E2H8_9PROT|nr:hypothetical protein [Dongia rigui]MDY0873703.1 hypothetical protein [Dongia rigui]
MTTDTYQYPDRPVARAVGSVESAFSAVSWSAILAGAAAAAAMSMILVSLGAGLGLLAVSPWQGEGASPVTLGVGVIAWSVVVHVVSFGVGGYLAGRLRTKWADVHGDEVFFRDTAHGFISWAVAILVSVCVMTSVAGVFAKGTASVAAAGVGAAGATAGAAAAASPGMENSADNASGSSALMAYFSDMLLRPASSPADSASTATTTQLPAPAMTPMTPAAPAGDVTQSRGEIVRILTVSLANGDVAAGDKAYLAQLVTNETGLPQAEAAKRVDDVIAQSQKAVEDGKTKAKQIADDARKAVAGAALWTFVTLLIGAFCAAYAATIGGRLRDQ